MQYKKATLGIFVMIILLSLNVLLLRKTVLQNSDLKKFEKELASVTHNATLNDLLLSLFPMQLESENYRLDADILLEDEKGLKISLSKVIGDNRKLILRYSDVNCNACVDHQLKYLKNVAAQIGDTSIFILATYKNKRDLEIFKRINGIKFPVYNTLNGGINLPIEKYETPYLFITDKSHLVYMVHVPVKEVPQLSTLYTAVVVEKFKNKL
jgi:hypothetical protein